MKARPEYFGWSPEAREHYGAAIPQDDRERLDQALLAELFGRRVRSVKAAARAAERLSLEQQNVWNEAILPLVGVGEDAFFLNEWLGDDETILDFESLRDFDRSDHRFQEHARAKEDPAYVRKPYRGALYLTWARLFVDDRFTYATLSMAAGYLSSEIRDHAFDLIERRVPHRYVRGKNHGKVEGESREWDLRADANGKEALLEALQDRVFEYEHERHEVLLTAWDQLGGCGVFVLDTSQPAEHNLHFVFTDTGALGAVRFRSFMRDVRAIERPARELEQCLDVERKALARFVDEQYESLRGTPDSSVIRLRRRRRVMVHRNAFDELA
ncbi:MAG: hypothetical protein HY017_26065 [Betaproteobacteria bacterium]|nr:hypothetical protein [Betaproteobacteria bacterium]